MLFIWKKLPGHRECRHVCQGFFCVNGMHREQEVGSRAPRDNLGAPWCCEVPFTNQNQNIFFPEKKNAIIIVVLFFGLLGFTYKFLMVLILQTCFWKMSPFYLYITTVKTWMEFFRRRLLGLYTCFCKMVALFGALWSLSEGKA